MILGWTKEILLHRFHKISFYSRYPKTSASGVRTIQVRAPASPLTLVGH